MYTVTSRIAKIKQPRGGYINPSLISKEEIINEKTLEEENVVPAIIGMAVDYLTRFLMGAPIEEAFKSSITGYEIRKKDKTSEIERDREMQVDIDTLLKQINTLDETSIIAACKACTYDVWYRDYEKAPNVKGASETNPDESTINNIKIMVERSVNFWEQYGPIVAVGLEFNEKAYTKTVVRGEIDYLTADTLWDFKVSKKKPTKDHTLQLLMYWIMGQHSEEEVFRNITKLGIFNPRLNTIYTIEINKIPKDVIQIVEKKVICYEIA